MKGFEASSIAAGYGGKSVLKGVSFSVENGELCGLVGANGSGKTTLIKSICGILPHAGESRLDGEALEGLSAKKLAAKCSYIPQRSGITLDISALDVVLMGFNPRLRLLEHPDNSMKKRALEALRDVSLGAEAETNYLHLSEGQKQMCILARSFVSDCRLVLMDEPESALDFSYRYRMLDMIARRLKNSGGIGIVALHDPMLALNFCDRLILLSDGVCAEVIRPKSDPLIKTEAALTRIYGKIRLLKCDDTAGKTHLVMLKETEATP